MAITTAAGVSNTLVTTDQQAPLGFELVVPTADQGEQVWIYVQNASGTPLLVNQLQQRAASSATYSVIVCGAVNPAQVVGLCVTGIPNGSFGFLLRKGIGTIVTAGAVTANTGLKPAASGAALHCGAVIDPACGNTLAGKVGAGGGTLSGYIDCKG